MTLRRKLLVAFSIMTVPLLVIGGLTLWNIREENQALRALEEGLGRVRIFAELESAVHRQVLKIRDYLTGWDRGAKREFDWVDRVVRELAEQWKGAVSHPEDVQLAEDFDRLYREIKDLAERALPHTTEGGGMRRFGSFSRSSTAGCLPTSTERSRPSTGRPGPTMSRVPSTGSRPSRVSRGWF